MNTYKKIIANHVCLFLVVLALLSIMGATWKNDQYVNRENSYSQVITYTNGVSETHAFPAQAKHVEVRWISSGSTGQCAFDFKTDKQDPVMDGSDENWVDVVFLVEHVDINALNINFRGIGGSGTIFIYVTW